jgi:Firmicute plasmid replication protein (RepL)
VVKKKKITVSEEITTIGADGQITKREQLHLMRLPQEPPYVKMYLQDIAKLYELPQNCSPLLYALVKLMDYDGMITVTKPKRKKIADELGISEKSIKNRLVHLQQQGILKRIDYCEYEMNPELFAKGDWHSIRRRRESFELKVTYTSEGERIVKGKLVSSDLEAS